MTGYICTKRVTVPTGEYVAHDCGWDSYVETYVIYDTGTAHKRAGDGHTILDGVEFEFVSPTFGGNHLPWRIDSCGCEYPNEFIDEARVPVQTIREAYERMVRQNERANANGRTYMYDQWKIASIALNAWIKYAEEEE